MNEQIETLTDSKRRALLDQAYIFAIITIVYNVGEGVISTILGFQDETLALAGFGFDSFVEVISGIAIARMVYRMKRSEIDTHDGFERTALRVTGIAFYLLTAGIIVGSALNIIRGTMPETTMAGVIISGISILTMWLLMRVKTKVGTALKSAPILADANCTRTCFYLSFILLASSLLYEFLRIPYIDAAGSLGIAWFAFREGREALEKARTGDLSCGCGDDACENVEGETL
ncbi:MAG: cation transporter [Spirochaetales bacterium]|jgi:divalent metal cation (Fe/Co/Zn/Cd) transporter|nr:cation transporter [Spirochaetales bacterium]